MPRLGGSESTKPKIRIGRRAGPGGASRAPVDVDRAIEEAAWIMEHQIHYLRAKQAGRTEELDLKVLDREDIDTLTKLATTLAAIHPSVEAAKERKMGRLDTESDEDMYVRVLGHARVLGEKLGHGVLVETTMDGGAHGTG